MPTWKRRSVLATGAALSLGGLASIAAGSEGDDAAELPDPDVAPNPGMADEDWPSFAGDAGHARFIEDGYEFDGDDLEVAWTATDSELASSIRVPSVAVADGTVYVTGPTTRTFERSSVGVAAYDAADGSLRWKNDDITVSDPSVVGDTVYVTGEELFALDASDGSVRWQTEFDPEEPIETQTVAYGAVFIVVDGTLYALEVDDGSVRWELDSITATTSSHGSEEEEFDFLDTTAAANGVVYAAVGDRSSGARLALEPATGGEVWRNERLESWRYSQIRATRTAVLFDALSYARTIVDAQTGEEIIFEAASEGADVVIGNEMFVGGDDYTYSAHELSATGEALWDVDSYFDSVASVISGDTVYAYFAGEELSDHPEYTEELVAFDKYDGTEKWVAAKSDLPVGPICAISDETIYVVHDGDLVALREQTDEEGDDQPDEGDEDGGNDDTDEEDEDEQQDGGNDDTDEGDDEQDGSEDEENEDEQQAGEDDSDEGEDDSDDEDECFCPDDDPADDEGESGGDDGGSVGGGDGDSGNGNAERGDTGNETATGNETDAGNRNETDAGDNTDTDDVPGFTTGAGLLGGAATLEWLRRKAGVDESTSVNEPAE